VIFKRLALFCLRFYRRWVSPGFPPVCRFYPTCSEYFVQAIGKHGLMSGSFLAFKRVVRCHPFHQGGYDPVP